MEKENKFIVTITGKNTNFEVPINNMKDFEDLEGILDVLKKKL
jgi:nitrate reductase NapAB chaperone NapD